MQQRIQPLQIDGFNEGKLQEKAKELHKEIYRLEAEKYDLEKRFKEQQYDVSANRERALGAGRINGGVLGDQTQMFSGSLFLCSKNI